MNEIKFENLAKLEHMNINNQEYSIEKDGTKYYFRLKINSKFKNIVIFSNGAVLRSKSELPVYSRYTWADEVNSNCIFIDDKTIHESNLSIGWGIGRENKYYLDEISLIIKKIISCISIKSEDTYYYGSSAGGTMSMILGIKHRGSKVIVNNPQMILENYLEGLPLKYLVNKFFKNYSFEEFCQEFKNRISIPHLLTTENYIPETLWILNRHSKVDYEQQYLPFIKELDDAGINTMNIEYLIYNYKNLGHNPLSKSRTLKLLNSYVGGYLK